MSFVDNVNMSGTRDEGFLAPVTPVGAVLFNGEINTTSVTNATTNTAPKYPLPGSHYLDYVGKVRQADVVYRFIDQHEFVEGGSERYTNTTVSGLSSLNGQGISGESEAAFMRRVQVLGLAFQDNEQNGSTRFNIHCGGIYTVVNNGNKNIPAGCWVRVRAPRLDELREGGRGEDADANGVVTLWLEPYYPEVHQATPTQIWHCLSRINSGPNIHTTRGGKHYMPEYEDMCRALFDSFLDVGLVLIEFLVRKGTLAWAGEGADRPSPMVLSALMGLLGHDRFRTNATANPILRQELVDAFFLAQLNRASEEYSEANFFSGRTEAERTLHECQMEGSGIAIDAFSRFIHTLTKDIIGRAVTSMAPKKNGQLHVLSYTGSK